MVGVATGGPGTAPQLEVTSRQARAQEVRLRGPRRDRRRDLGPAVSRYFPGRCSGGATCTTPRLTAQSTLLPSGSSRPRLALIEVVVDAVFVSLAESAIAIPSRLRDLVADSSDGAMRQPGVSVRPGRWIDALGDYAGVLKQLPGEVDRVNGCAFALARPESREGAVAGFIASQIWGYGTNGYGPFRLRKALAYPGLLGVLGEARVRVQNQDPVGAFRVLCVEHHIAYVGAAFGSKFLFFIDPHGRALILDRVVRGWLAEHAGLRLRGGRDEREYAVWLRASAFVRRPRHSGETYRSFALAR